MSGLVGRGAMRGLEQRLHRGSRQGDWQALLGARRCRTHSRRVSTCLAGGGVGNGSISQLLAPVSVGDAANSPSQTSSSAAVTLPDRTVSGSAVRQRASRENRKEMEKAAAKKKALLVVKHFRTVVLKSGEGITLIPPDPHPRWWGQGDIGVNQEVVQAHAAFNYSGSFSQRHFQGFLKNAPSVCQHTECAFDDHSQTGVVEGED
jgi:hypothetical protein